MSIGQAIRQLREEREWGLRDLAAKVTALGLPLSHQAVQTREKGAVPVNPRERKIFARVFELSLEDFDKRWRGSKLDRTDGDESGRRGIPVINRAPAGMVIDYNEYGVDSGQGYEYIERGTVDDDLAFAVVVVGDSMEPRLHEGDYLIFSPLNVPKPRAALDVGCVAFIRFAPDSKKVGCCLARFMGKGPDGKLRFSKDNPKHKGHVLAPTEIEQLAVAVERRSRAI